MSGNTSEWKSLSGQAACCGVLCFTDMRGMWQGGLQFPAVGTNTGWKAAWDVPFASLSKRLSAPGKKCCKTQCKYDSVCG